MIDLHECRCPDCGILLCKSTGIVETICKGRGKTQHEQSRIRFENGKVIDISTTYRNEPPRAN